MTEAPDDKPWPPHAAAGIRKSISQSPYSFPVPQIWGRGWYQGIFLSSHGSRCPERARGLRNRGPTSDRTGLPEKGHPSPRLEAGACLPSNHTLRSSGMPFLQGGLRNPILQASLLQKTHRSFFPGKKKKCHSLAQSLIGSTALQVKRTELCYSGAPQSCLCSLPKPAISPPTQTHPAYPSDTACHHVASPTSSFQNSILGSLPPSKRGTIPVSSSWNSLLVLLRTPPSLIITL